MDLTKLIRKQDTRQDRQTASSVSSPIACSACCPTIPHAGYAAVQDDSMIALRRALDLLYSEPLQGGIPS
jgi:hypothetical protein